MTSLFVIHMRLKNGLIKYSEVGKMLSEDSAAATNKGKLIATCKIQDPDMVKRQIEHETKGVKVYTRDSAEEPREDKWKLKVLD